YQRAAFNNLGTASDGNFRIFKLAARTAMADSQFRNLARSAGSGVLMTLAAGLRIVKRAEAFINLLDLVELGLIHSVRGVVHHPVSLVVKAGGCFGKIRTRSTKTKNIDNDSQDGDTKNEFHEHLVAGVGRLNVTHPFRKTKWKMGAFLNDQSTAQENRSMR